MGSSDRNNGEAISQINVTPLVDVMLVLLVIFMVTAPILHQGVSVQLPQVRAAALLGEETQLVLSVTRSGEVHLNDQRISTEDLRRKLAAILRESPDRQVFLRADRNVAYGRVMEVMAAVKEAGVQRLGMVTEPPASQE